MDEKQDFFDTEKTQENTGEEDWTFIGAEGFVKIIDFQSFSLLFILSSHLILCLSWTLEIAIRCIWLWEANSLFLGEIGRTRCWFFSIISNKFMQYSVFILVILAGLFYLLLQLRDWIEEIRFNLIKLERGNWIESGIVRTQLRHHKYREEIGSLGSLVINRKDREWLI